MRGSKTVTSPGETQEVTGSMTREVELVHDQLEFAARSM